MIRDSKINIVAAPFGEGAGIIGSEFGPEALLHLGFDFCNPNSGYDVTTEILARPEIPPYVPLNNAKVYGHTIAYATAIHDRLTALWEEDPKSFPMMLGGDHSLSIGSILAARAHAVRSKKKFLCIYVDAHTDFNTMATTPSGNTHGMTITAAMGLEPFLTTNIRDPQWLRPSEMIYFGARDIDPPEKEMLDDMPDVRILRAQWSREATKAINHIVKRIDVDTHVHLSFDVDVLDPGVFHATGLNVPDGLSVTPIKELFIALARTRQVRSLDVVEYNPLKDNQNEDDARLILQLVDYLFNVSHR